MTTKEKVLAELNQNQGKSVSGEDLAAKCNVSRAAIWKAVKSLREEGLQITGTTNGGYQLEPNGDFINDQLFMTYINSHFPALKDLQAECFKEIDSTNSYAKKLLSENQSIGNKIIVAESQTAGRGRLGRNFYSPAKTGIYLSIIHSPKGGIEKPAQITAFTAVAVCRAIKKIYGINPQIKWINDIFVNGKKVGGILTEGFTNFETRMIESAVIGIGINIVENSEAPSEIKNIAGGILEDSSNAKTLRCEFAAELAGQVLTILNNDTDQNIEEYKKLSFIIGQEVKVYPVINDEASAYIAKAIDIDEDANLVVQLKDGSKKSLYSGEVSLKSINFSN